MILKLSVKARTTLKIAEDTGDEAITSTSSKLRFFDLVHLEKSSKSSAQAYLMPRRSRFYSKI